MKIENAQDNLKERTKVAEKSKRETPAQIRICLPDVVAARALETMRVLKDRKSDVKLDELFTEVLLKLDEHFYDAQVEKFTPSDHYLELAKAHPKVQALIIRQVRRALERVSRGEEVTRQKTGGKAKRDPFVEQDNVLGT